MSARLEYRAAVSARDWAEAARLKRDNPDILGAPPEGVPDDIAALANAVNEPAWMVVEWSIQRNACDDTPNCRPITLIANQFDHVPAGLSAVEVRAWFNEYIANRQANAPDLHQVGQTLFLLKVEDIEQITDFHGEVLF